MTRYSILIATAILTLTLIFTITSQSISTPLELEFFYSEGCPDCQEAKPIIETIQEEYKNNISITWREITLIENWEIFIAYNLSEVPALVINKTTKLSKEEITKDNLEKIINKIISGEKPENNKSDNIMIINTPFGVVNLSGLTLPIITILLAGLDSINPCSFWVLFFLLSLLIYAQSRKRMLLIGGIFVFFSGFIYLLFMALLLGVFILTAQLPLIATIAGGIAIILGVINIKDFFFFKKGLSLSIPDEKRPELLRRMRNIVKSSYLPSMILGTIMLSIFANTYELFCTMGFPLVYTKILTLYNLEPLQYYLYLILYNIVYVLPLLSIVIIFTLTLGSRKLTEKQGRILKLFSGLMILMLGLMLILQPSLLTNMLIVMLIPLISLVITVSLAVIENKIHKNRIQV
ncbi:MAG: thioredoxin domain-containing protein [Candidatus Thermoplasmatota archaeon]